MKQRTRRKKRKNKPRIPVATELPYSCSGLKESENYLMVGLLTPTLPAGGCYKDYTTLDECP